MKYNKEKLLELTSTANLEIEPSKFAFIRRADFDKKMKQRLKKYPYLGGYLDYNLFGDADFIEDIDKVIENSSDIVSESMKKLKKGL